jgi:hypothetical protein
VLLDKGGPNLEHRANFSKLAVLHNIALLAAHADLFPPGKTITMGGRKQSCTVEIYKRHSGL